MILHLVQQGSLMRLKAVLIGLAVMSATSAEAATVTRVWHVDRNDPDSTLCRESGGSRTIITTGASSAARYDDPTPAEWQRAGCEASRPRMISHAEVLRRLNEQTDELRAYTAWSHPDLAQAAASASAPQQ